MVWGEIFSKKINKEWGGHIKPPPIITKVKLLIKLFSKYFIPYVKALLKSAKFVNNIFLVFRGTVQENRGPPEGVVLVAYGGRRGGG